MVLIKYKKGQAAIEFLMTYGWMLLVVLIVGALIFSFVDFSSLLPASVNLQGNFLGMSDRSAAYSNGYTVGAYQNHAYIFIRYTGSEKTSLNASDITLAYDINPSEQCTAANVTNIDTQASSSISAGNSISFLNGQEAMIDLNCTSLDGNAGLTPGDTLTGELRVLAKDPKSGFKVPTTGNIRIPITK